MQNDLSIICFLHIIVRPNYTILNISCALELLKEVHFLGKASKNIFSAAQDFSLTSSDEVGTHPALSFKAHLIRLIGNLCHGHTANQNQVRHKQTTQMQEKNNTNGVFLTVNKN